MTKNKFGLTAMILFLTITFAATVWQRAAARDKIEYDAVYDCGEDKPKFNVLSCKGTGKFDRCEIFNINQYSPGGGNKVLDYRSQIENNINQGCKVEGLIAARNERDENSGGDTADPRTNNNQSVISNEDKTDNSVACFVSDEDSVGKTANEKTFRGVIRRLWEKEAEKGSDGAVTIAFQKFVIGAPRRWQPTLTDAYSQADPKKPIYPVRALFETCTDYKTAINKRKMERIYDCFAHKTGGWQCTQTGASGALATKDKKEYIPKNR